MSDSSKLTNYKSKPGIVSAKEQLYFVLAGLFILIFIIGVIYFYGGASAKSNLINLFTKSFNFGFK